MSPVAFPVRFIPRLILVVASILISGCTSSTPSASAKPQEKRYAFWPPAPDDPHVQFLVSYRSSQDIAPPGSKFDEMLYGKAEGVAIVKPYGVAMWNGRIYVADLRTRGVIVLDLKTKQTRIMGMGGKADLQTPVSVAIGRDGTKYVADSGKNAIVVFSADERYLTTFTQKNFHPVDLTVWENELFVSDFDASTVKVLDARSGVLLRTIGSLGSNAGQFARPLGLRMDNQGNLLVADVLNCRVQKFTRDGKLIMSFGGNGDRPGEFVRPKHLTTDNQGMIYVVDAAFSNVQVFDDSGKIVGFFGSLGNHPGSMNLPAGICVSETDLDLFAQYVHPAFEAKRLIIVTNQFGSDKVAVYAEGQLKPGKTVADLSTSRSDVETGLASGAAPTSQPITIGVPLPPELLPTTAPASNRP